MTLPIRLLPLLFSMALPTTLFAGTIDLTTGVQESPADAAFSVTSQGVTFSFEPVRNFTGEPRWVPLGPGGFSGISFGGAGGGSVEFAFRVDTPVTLLEYQLGGGSQFGSPEFDILQGETLLSAANTGFSDGYPAKLPFRGGPLQLEANVPYTFLVNSPGELNQSGLASLKFEPVPEPATASLLVLALGTAARRRPR